MGVSSVEGDLLEREAELELAEGLMEGARAGEGALLAIEGEPGIGKTRLLKAVRELAERAGFSALSSPGLELERDFAFGVVSRLFGPALARADVAERNSLLQGPARLALAALYLDGAEGHAGRSSPQRADPSFSILHGLYWLAANLSERGPLLLAIDDAHWSDDASLRFLGFLTPRLQELPTLLVVTLRSGEESPLGELLPRLLQIPGSRSIAVEPLSEAAVANLVRDRLSQDADQGFCRACHEATGGNPFLLGQLLPEFRAEGISPTATSAKGVGELAPQAVSRSVLVRLARLPPEATRMAKAVAVLGDGANLSRAASLAGLERAGAASAADALVRAHILARGPTLAFKHPLIRAAVDSELEAAERAEAHARAAKLLREQGVAPEQVAVHLLKAWPGGDPQAAATLREAAARTLGRGAAATAAVYLRRALEEPLRPTQRARMLAELGEAEIRAGDAEAAAEHLREALASAQVPAERSEWASLLARALWFSGQPREAAALLEDAIAEAATADPDRALRLESDLFGVAFLDRSLLGTVRTRADRMRGTRIEGATASERLALAALATSVGARGESASETRDLAERGLGAGRLLAELTSDSQVYWSTVFTLLRTEAFDQAEEHIQAGIADARTRGSVGGFVMGSSLHSQLTLRRGEVAEAIATGESCLETSRLHDWLLVFPYSVAFLIDALVERGALDRAQQVLEESGLVGELPDTVLAMGLLLSRGRLLLQRGETSSGIEDLFELGRRKRAWQFENPAAHNWASLAAPALAPRGEGEQAIELARKELELSRRWGARGQIGISLRALGLVEGGERGVELLGEAVASLRDSEMRLEHARGLVDLGASLRRGGRRAEARRPLRDGHELAVACGATALVERARQELAASGARPRSVVRTGLDELTPSERRVATMAANGMSNPEIAAALFVTTKTIESHLSHAYRKLEISSRRELTAALTPDQGS